METTDLSLVFAAGLLGSAHCLGMCGGFVLAITTPRDRTAGVLHQLLYFLGKTATYTVLGLIVGGLGAVLTGGFQQVQAALSILAGVLMVAIGLGLLGVLSRFNAFNGLARFPSFQQALAYFLQQRSYKGTFGLGLLNGLLPCGLVYGLLAKAAATGTWIAGGLTMAVFGVATIPALFALGLTGHLLRPVWRARLNYASGVIILLLGLLTVLRGTPAIKPILSIFGGSDHTHEGMPSLPLPADTTATALPTPHQHE